NVGLYVGRTSNLVDQGSNSIDGITAAARGAGLATQGIFDSIIVKDFAAEDHFSAGVIVHSTYGASDKIRSKHLGVTFVAPFIFTNYQGFQIDQSSVVHFPNKQSLLAVNSDVHLTAPGFIPAFVSSGGATGTFVPEAGAIAHSGQAGLILPPDNTGDTGAT